MNETPFCLALLMADFIQRDSGGKWTIVGTFDLMWFPAFPADVDIGVFFSLTDSRGTMPLKIQFVDVAADFDDTATQEPIGFMEGEFTINDPLEVFQGTALVPAKFPREGAYNLELWANRERIMTRRLTVKQKDQPRAQHDR